MTGNSLNLNNADKHVWSCSILAGFSNKRMMNKIDEFEIFDLPRESERRRNHTEEYNRKNRTPQSFNWLKQKCFEAYDLHIKMYGYENLPAKQKLSGF